MYSNVSQNFIILKSRITISIIFISLSVLTELILNIRSIKIIALRDTLNQEKFEEISGRINDVSNLYFTETLTSGTSTYRD